MVVDNEKVFELIVNSTEDDLSAAQIALESRFLDDLAFDSISFLTLALRLSEEFNFDIAEDNEAYYLVQTVGDLVTFLNNRLG